MDVTRWLTAALVVMALACVPAVAALARHGADTSQRLSERSAVAHGLADPGVRRYLDRSGYTRVRVLSLDRRVQRVSFYDGSRIVLEAAVDPDGQVRHSLEYRPGHVRMGSEVIQRPAVILLVLGLVFALMLMRLPLRSAVNLDALALAATTATISLQNERLIEPSVYAGFALVSYLALRLLWIGLASAAPRPTRALLDVFELRRTLAYGAAGAAALLAIVSVPGGIVVDVGFASIAGATNLLHGQAPYGHIPAEVVHGDTYPLLAYASYLPAAALTPVHDAFSNADGALWTAAAAALITAAAIRKSTAGTAGLRLAIAWLVFPPTLVAASSGSNDLVAAACVAGAVALAVHAARPVLLLTLAGWVKVVPLALVPLWVARAPRDARARTAAAALAVCAAVIGWLLLLDGGRAVSDMVDGISFQAERGTPLSLWTLTGAHTAQVVFQCAVCGVVGLAAVRAWNDRALAGDMRRVAALSAAILLGFQLAANYWTPAYLTWVFPLIVVAMFTADPATAVARARKVAS